MTNEFVPECVELAVNVTCRFAPACMFCNVTCVTSNDDASIDSEKVNERTPVFTFKVNDANVGDVVSAMKLDATSAEPSTIGTTAKPLLSLIKDDVMTT